MINLFAIFTFHMNFLKGTWKLHPQNYLMPFFKKIVILRLCQFTPYLTYFEWKGYNNSLNSWIYKKDLE